MSVSPALANPASPPVSGAAAGCPTALRDMQSTCAVRLMDRRTGAVHRVNGTPLMIVTRNPQAAAVELLDGRDPTLWEAWVEPFADGYGAAGKQSGKARRR